MRGFFVLLSLVRTFIIMSMAERSNQNFKHRNRSRRADPLQVAADYGIDVSMLADNLKRSVAERIRRHQLALNTVEKLRKAKRP